MKNECAAHTAPALACGRGHDAIMRQASEGVTIYRRKSYGSFGDDKRLPFIYQAVAVAKCNMSASSRADDAMVVMSTRYGVERNKASLRQFYPQLASSSHKAICAAIDGSAAARHITVAIIATAVPIIMNIVYFYAIYASAAHMLVPRAGVRHMP